MIKRSNKLKDYSIAKNILAQLGGNRFFTMTGAKNTSVTESGVSFRFSGKGTNHVEINLDSNDTYTMKFSYIRGFNVRTVKTITGVYIDQLETLFEGTTGLYTRL